MNVFIQLSREASNRSLSHAFVALGDQVPLPRQIVVRFFDERLQGSEPGG